MERVPETGPVHKRVHLRLVFFRLHFIFVIDFLRVFYDRVSVLFSRHFRTVSFVGGSVFLLLLFVVYTLRFNCIVFALNEIRSLDRVLFNGAEMGCKTGI